VPFQCRITVRAPPPTAQAFLAEVAATADTQQMMADCAVLPERLGRAALAAQAVARPDAVSANPAATAQNIRVICLLMGCRTFPSRRRRPVKF
jgi:hypothetical protein